MTTAPDVMPEAKRRRLESRGWQVGSAQEFLGLTDGEAAMIEIRVRLAQALRDVRRSRRWTQAQVAARLGSSQSRVAKMEAADQSVSLDLLVRSLYAVGASGREIGAAFAAVDVVPPRASRPSHCVEAAGRRSKEMVAWPSARYRGRKDGSYSQR